MITMHARPIHTDIQTDGHTDGQMNRRTWQ